MKLVQLAILCTFGCKYSGCEHIFQEHTLPTAVARHTRWTADELDLVMTSLDEPITDVALVLDRTYYAVARIRSQLKRGILKT